jgi:hypothetical protein
MPGFGRNLESSFLWPWVRSRRRFEGASALRIQVKAVSSGEAGNK